MNLKDKLDVLIRLSNKKIIDNPNKAELYISSNEIEISINGTPSIIEIKYNGICRLTNKLPILFKVSYSKNSIVIMNLLKKELPKILFTYEGNIQIKDCEILTCDLNIFKEKLYNNQLKEIVDGQGTKFEDDTTIIQENYRSSFGFSGRTLTTHSFIDLVQNARQKLDGVPKKERIKIIEKAVKVARTKIAPKIAPKIKTAIKKEPTKKGGKY